MDFGDLVERRGAPGPDRPARLIGDRQPVAIRQIGHRFLDLRLHYPRCTPGVALGIGFADAQDDAQPVAMRGARLGPGVLARLALIGAAFAMPDDREPCTRLDQHRRRQAPGMRAALVSMNVLPANREPWHQRNRGGDQRGGQGNRHVDRARGIRSGRDRRQFGQRCAAAVHLPIARHELASHHPRLSIFVLRTAIASRACCTSLMQPRPARKATALRPLPRQIGRPRP